MRALALTKPLPVVVWLYGVSIAVVVAVGVIAVDAYADLLIVDGNPFEDLDLVSDPENNFVLIMKDGKIYKNTIE